MPLTTYTITEDRPAVGIRWFGYTNGHQLKTLKKPAEVWPVGEPLYCQDKIGCRTYRANLCLEDNENNIVVAIMGWGEVDVGGAYWQAEYAQPIAIIETHPQLRDSVLKVAEKHALPVRHGGYPDGAMSDFEGFDEFVKDIY